MAKKNTKVQNNDYLFDFNDDLNSKNNKPIEDVIENSMLKYGSHITLNRAIPNALDGLKPVQRRIFYSFFYSNITNSFEKLANVTGICMGKFHPHGDSSINEATANLLQPWKNTFPLLEGYGNWGSSSGDNCAAMRYIEVKIPKEHAELLFDNIKKDGVVPWMKNYNDKIDEPMLLPSKFPLHLINGTSGIGYSTSTNIPPYNINELTQAMIYMIDNKFWSHEHWDINEHKDNLVDIIKGPDSPMSTNIYFQEQDKYAYLLKSKYSFRMRADMDIDYDNHQITIYNYPFGLTGEAIKQELMDLSLEKRTIKRGNKTVEIDKHESEILKVANENPIMSEYTNEHEFSMIINFRKDANLDVEAVKILSKTKMDITFNVNHIVINDKNIPEEIKKQTGIKISKANLSREHSVKAKLNMSNAQRERESPTQLTKDKISKTLLGFKNTNTSSKYIGVSYINNKDKLWRATIRFNRINIIIGHFKEELHAAVAYNIKAKELYKKEAKLNDIPNWETIDISKKRTSKYFGVSFKKKPQKWETSVYFNGKHNYIGSYNSELEAAQAYNEFIQKHNINKKKNDL